MMIMIYQIVMLILIVVIPDHDCQLMTYDENNTFNFCCNDDKHNIVAMMATIIPIILWQ